MNVVLVVDDNVDTGESLRLILTAHGFVPLIATDGPSALALIEEVRPSVIMSDLMMPLMSGAEFCSAIRAHPAYARTPIIVATSLDEEETRRHFECFDAHLQKPVDPEILLALLHKFTDEPLDIQRASLQHSWPMEKFNPVVLKFLEKGA